MTSVVRAAAIAAGLVLCATGAVAQSPAPAAQQGVATFKVGAITIEAPWTRAAPEGARVAGGFMKITNTGKEPDRLIGGAAPFSKAFEVHEMAMDAGVMKMREVAGGIVIAPGQTVELKPGGYHVMFMGLTEPPKPGAKVKTTLKFEKAGSIDVELDVRMRVEPGAAHKH